MSERIRWHDEPPGTSLACKGYVGTLGGAVFKIYRPDQAHRNWLGIWQLANSDDRYFHGGTLDDAKDQAERWLARFVSYLGALFPDTDRADTDRKRRAAELCRPLMEASDADLRDALILIGTEKRRRLWSLLQGRTEGTKPAATEAAQ
jgi:hypothetical protein